MGESEEGAGGGGEGVCCCFGGDLEEGGGEGCYGWARWGRGERQGGKGGERSGGVNLDLSECELEACWSPVCSFGKGEGEFDVCLCMNPRQVQRFNNNFRRRARFKTLWYFHDPLLRSRNPVADDGVLAPQMVEGGEVVTVDDFYFLGRTTLGEDLDRLDGFLVLG